MWLTGRLVPDHKTIADFRKDNGPAIRLEKLEARMLATPDQQISLTDTQAPRSLDRAGQLCGQAYVAHFFQQAFERWFRSHAHGSIGVHEGEPMKTRG